MPISTEDTLAVQESLLVLLTGLLEAASEIASSSEALIRMAEIEGLCADAHSVADLAVTVSKHGG